LSATATIERPAEGARGVLAAVEAHERRRPAPIAMAALRPMVSLADPALAAIAAPELELPGDIGAECRVARAELTIRLRDEFGMSTKGASEIARRVVGRSILALMGFDGVGEAAKLLGVNRRTLQRDEQAITELGERP
jgi:hypothetical protein